MLSKNAWILAKKVRVDWLFSEKKEDLMNAYFLEAATVRLAANLLGVKLIDNYGYHGSLSRFSVLELRGISEGEGIEDVPRKAGCFNLGAVCGRMIDKHLGRLSEKEAVFIDAEIARNIFLDLSPEKQARYTDAEIESAMRVIFTSMIKKAQIRTHTAKPGEEDINKWLEGYYYLQKNFDSFVISLVEEIVAPDAKLVNKFSSFFDKDDPIVALALQKNNRPESLEIIYRNVPKSIFGKILLDVVQSIV
jgi:hypothetical protein